MPQLAQRLRFVWRSVRASRRRTGRLSSSLCSLPSSRPTALIYFFSRGVTSVIPEDVCSFKFRLMTASDAKPPMSSIKSPDAKIFFLSQSEFPAKSALAHLSESCAPWTPECPCAWRFLRLVRSRPSSCSHLAAGAHHLLIVSIMCTGIRMVRAWSFKIKPSRG